MASGHDHETIDEAPPPLPSERSTGLVFAVATLIAALLLRHIPLALWLLGATSLTFLALALIQPQRLAPLNRAWFRLALFLNRFVSPVVMFLIYAGVIVPAGLLMQAVRDPLQARGRGKPDSYWINRADGLPRTGMRDQF